MDVRCMIRDAVIGTALAACWPMAAHAQITLGRQSTTVQTVTTSAYLNGGIGLDEQATMRSFAKEFPLRIIFCEGKDREFLADVPMVISDSSGNPIFQLRSAGPMLYVMLPQGRYTVSARFKGVTRTLQVTLAANGGKDLLLHWERTNERSWDGGEGLIQSSLDPGIQ
jgi:hypothetical protein